MYRIKIKNTIGWLLGSTCFIPVFMYCNKIDIIKPFWVSVLLIVITQLMWLTSLTLLCIDLDIENKELREKIKDLEVKK